MKLLRVHRLCDKDFLGDPRHRDRLFLSFVPRFPRLFFSERLGKGPKPYVPRHEDKCGFVFHSGSRWGKVLNRWRPPAIIL